VQFSFFVSSRFVRLSACLLLVMLGGALEASTKRSPTLRSIAVTPANLSIAAGTTLQFVATGKYSDGSTKNITTTVTWVASKPAVATINATGLSTGIAPGSATIRGTLGTVSGSTGLTVTAAALRSIIVAPANPSIRVGATQQFAATGSYSDGSTRNLTSAVAWSSTVPSVATISNTSGSQGLATSAAAGQSTIQATYSAIIGSTTLTVMPAPTLQSITVTPGNSDIESGATQPFTAIGSYSDASTQDLTASIIWSSSVPSSATISAAGLASCLQPGSSTVQAASAGIVGAALLTVTPVTIAVTPTNVSVALSANQQFTASVSGAVNQTVSWSVDGVPGGSSALGTISGSGLYTASPMISIHTIIAVAQPSGAQTSAAVTIGSSDPVPNTFFGMHLRLPTDPVPAAMDSSGRVWDTGNAQWANVNTASDTFQWAALDNLLAAYSSAGINDAVYALWRVPQWASSNPTDTSCDYSAQGSTQTGECNPPTDLNPDGTGTNLIWRSWVQAIAQHVNNPNYLQSHARISYWDVCNECYRSPTLRPGYQSSTYAYKGTYAQLLRMMQDARCIIIGNPSDSISALNTTCGQAGYPVTGIDPSARMLMPNTSPGPPNSSLIPFAQVIQNLLYCTCANNSCSTSSTACSSGSDGSAAMDIVDAHLYPSNFGAPEQLPDAIAQLRTYLSASDATKPLWASEGGWGKNTSLPDPDLQSSFIARYYMMLWASGVQRAYWYAWDNLFYGSLWFPASGTGCTTPWNGGYICDAGVAYQQVHDWMVGATLTGCSVNGTTWTCTLSRSGGYHAAMVWDTSQTCSSGICGTSAYSADPQYLHYRDLQGSVFPVDGAVPAGIKPILLENQ